MGQRAAAGARAVQSTGLTCWCSSSGPSADRDFCRGAFAFQLARVGWWGLDADARGHVPGHVAHAPNPKKHAPAARVRSTSADVRDSQSHQSGDRQRHATGVSLLLTAAHAAARSLAARPRSRFSWMTCRARGRITLDTQAGPWPQPASSVRTRWPRRRRSRGDGAAGRPQRASSSSSTRRDRGARIVAP
jgi:hypothetical protein